MTDRYIDFVNSPLGQRLASALGLPQPVPLQRWQPRAPEFPGPVLIEAAPGGELAEAAARALAGLGASVLPASQATAQAGCHALVLDATGVRASGELRVLYDFFHPRLRSLAANARVLVLARPPEEAQRPSEAVASRALEGAVRSIAKELRRGATAQLVYVARGAEEAMASTLRFFASPRSAYVSGQVVRLGVPVDGPASWDPSRPLAGRTAVVTGASRGIGEAIVRVLHREGALVIGVDVPAADEALQRVCNDVDGRALPLDITAPDAGQRIAARAEGRVDLMVHNAGITRDKRLVNMREDQWTSVIEVNLAAQERITEHLLAAGALPHGGRVVCVSSMSGIAGNAGQVNYAASKAGVIGLVQSYAPLLAPLGATINGVAPGFIETQMTAAIPFAIREAGRRMNSLGQGGQPVDVAEAIAWLAHPGSGGVNGQVLRVCGQSWLGA
ncbi:MAG TPA: 3-oxoacyl-ACP reductase [Burkholderiaceae bacterium]|nr:3-oxoacyl-ACP reductase [Burkholderiaceae bacterium]